MAGSQPEYDFPIEFLYEKPKKTFGFSLYFILVTLHVAWAHDANSQTFAKNSHSHPIKMLSLEFRGFMFKLQSRIFTN